MHGIWLLVFTPVAAVVAWRFSGTLFRKLATYSMALTGVGLAGWLIFLVVEGAEYSGTIYDRVMHAMGAVFIESISFPIIQVLLALLVIVCWPRRFEFSSANAKTDVNTNPDPDPVPMPVLDAELQ